MQKLIVIGAGGHGRVVADAARVAGIELCAFVDRKPPATMIEGLPVYASLEEASDALGVEASQLSFIVAIGDNCQRAEEYARAREQGFVPLSVIHPTAAISETAHISAGAYVGAQAVINPGAQIGEDSIINTAAVIEHDCRVGSHSFVAPGAVLCGAARIGNYTLVGTNATLIPLVSVGAQALVAAGAVVVDSHPDNVRLFGVPAQEA